MDDPGTNATAPSDPPYSWEAEPNHRGTFGIISLCFSTLFVCTWNTLHFNVPVRRYTATRRLFIQLRWAGLALVAPVVLLYIPINDRITAGVLLKRVLEFHPHLAKPGILVRMYNWIRRRVRSKEVSAQCQSTVIN